MCLVDSGYGAHGGVMLCALNGNYTVVTAWSTDELVWPQKPFMRIS